MDQTTTQKLFEKELQAAGYPQCSIKHLRNSLLYQAAIAAIKIALTQSTNQPINPSEIARTSHFTG
jgi:hypothetical protein